MSNSNSISGEFFEQVSHLAECSINLPPEEFWQMLPEKICEYLVVDTCIIWIRDYQTETYKVLATAGEVDDEYKKTELDIIHPGVQFRSTQQVFYLRDISQENYRLADKKQLIEKGYKSLLSSPLKIQEEVIGILDVYTRNIRIFKSREKKFFLSAAQYLTISLQKHNLDRANATKKQNLDSLTAKIRQLTEIILKITNTSTTRELYLLLLEGASQLVSPAKIAIFRLNYRNGRLKVAKTSNGLLQKKSARYGIGFVGKCLEENQPRNIENIDDLKNHYIPHWQDSKSALIIPIVIDKIQVRIGTNLTEGSKAIGVLVLESSQINYFQESDKDLLISLACHAAIEIERIRSQRKISSLREIEQKIAREQNYEKIMQAVVEGITKTLKFEMANISLVNPERTRIKSEFVSGVFEEQKKIFQKKVDHSLNSDDIQAYIVKNKTIEVPDYNDNRFNQEIYKQFNHQRFIRIFMPMIEGLNDQVIGTVEAGYNRSYQKYIYEWDVQILVSFVNVAVQASERRKLGWLDRIIHELRSPLVGMRANASFLQRRFNQIDKSLIYIKINDIIEDSEMLLFQVRQLESYWGGRNYRKSKIEKVYVVRDIVIKTINQLIPAMRDRGFSISNIITPVYKHTIIYTDKIQLNQIIYNLLINAIKYADNDHENFRITVEVEPSNSQFIQLKFKDWGIGISEDNKEKIFDEGFRESAAMQKNVSGSGLGLYISRTIAREMGGDLKIVKFFHPTEFLLTVYNHKF